ncbi:MAG: hypothetical protein B6243_04105 [Anaerolineaceae bacterium 4572_5.2]|nr:MAG: hypothetical protein B6243_04105 [Anaerolineaceae bacterium 4572_5.2]
MAENVKEAEKVEAVKQSKDGELEQKKSGSRETRPHAFVVMPFGQKKGFEGQIIDFNAIYQDLIKPSLEEAGFEPFRADEESVSGDILTDMFQELLLADLVICDMSIDNANVFYEVGVRHAMRKRGVVHIQSGRAYMPFDIFNVRTIPYHTGDDGKPDPEHLEKDIQNISRVCRDTWASDQEAVHSPIFNLLTGLTEPDRKALRTPLATGFWREYNEWRERVTIAQRQKRIGDVMLLTEEISNPLIKEEAIGEAGRALRGMGRHSLALQQYRQGLELNSKNMEFRRQEAFHLNCLGKVDEAIVKLENLLQDDPSDTEAIAYLGRIYKDMWTESWERIEDEDRRLQEAFAASHWLAKSIQTYLRGFYCDLNEYYPGINALTLAIILDHLAEKFDEGDDPDIQAIRDILPNLKGTLEFALENLAKDDASDYWTLVSLADLKVMIAENPKEAKRAYKKALTAARKNIFYLESSIEQLNTLNLLALRPEYVDVGIQVLKDEIRRIRKEEPEEEMAATDVAAKNAGAKKKATEEKDSEPGRVYLFSGHKIDKSTQSEKRFLPEMEKEARKRIDELLTKYEADENDLAVTAGAACGGDIIFIEACLERGMTVEVHLPFSEPKYIKENVSFGGEHWVDRFYNLRNNTQVNISFQLDHVGAPKEGDDPYMRNNRWALYSSLLQGIDRVRLIALWDGKTAASDSDGMLVSHLVEEVRSLGGYVEHINTTKFDYWQAGGKVGAALDKLAGL